MKPVDEAAARATVRCWCVYELVDRAMAAWYEPEALHLGKLALAVYVGAVPRLSTLGLMLAVRLGDTFCRIPFIWDCDHWGLQMDAGILFLCVFIALSRFLCRKDGASGSPDAVEAALVRAWSYTLRMQLVCFYLAAGFWKLNSSFLDHRTSCAPMFVLLLLSNLGITLPGEVMPAIAKTSAYVTVVGEMCIAIFLASNRDRVRRLGVALAIVLHAGIALTPPPNNAVPFSVVCAVRLMMTMPLGLRKLANEMGRFDARAALTAAMATAVAAVCTGIAYRRALRHPPPGSNAEVPFWVTTYFVLAVYAIRLLMLGTCINTNATGGDTDSSVYTTPSSSVFRIVHVLSVLFSATYAFLFIPLGLQDHGTPNMYSNLRIHGGSNHYLVRQVDLLRFLLPEEAARRTFSVVRVEKCSSEWINTIYPGDLTMTMSPDERALLASVNHTARMFNPMKLRVLGASVLPSSPSGVRTKYSLTALELRRVLAEARERGEAFQMTYTVLEGFTGDEQWRSKSSGRTIHLREDGIGGRECFAEDDVACTGDEFANLPPPSFLIRKWLVQQPYPILEGVELSEVTCFGP